MKPAWTWQQAERAVGTLRQTAIAVAAVAGVFLFSVNAAQAIFCLYSGSNSASASSWLAGARAGYNWQQGSWVYGFETDISVTKLKSDMNGGLVATPASCDMIATANTTGTVDWYGTARGRVGWTSGQFLFYGTGGLAYGKVNLNSYFNDPDPGTDPTSILQRSSIRAGWVAGGGIEYMLRPNLLLNLGYQYVDLGTASLAGSASSPGGFLTINQSANDHAHFQVFTLGLSWRFAPAATTANDAMASGMPVKAPTYKIPSNPWEGMYLGGHVGGAWGNNTNANYNTVTGGFGFPP
jgi:outer membrane immunogenic protein